MKRGFARGTAALSRARLCTLRLLAPLLILCALGAFLSKVSLMRAPPPFRLRKSPMPHMPHRPHRPVHAGADKLHLHSSIQEPRDELLHAPTATTFVLNVTAPRLRILIYKESWHRSVQIARDGGPGGELGMYRSLLASLERVRPHHAQIVHVQSREDLGKQNVESFDILFSDQYSVQDWHEVHGDFFERRRCRFRMVDFWGTPPEQNSFGMHLKQYLVPYPNPWNQFAGFITTGDSMHESKAPRPPRGPPYHVIVHGKDERYFHDGARASLEQAARLVANRTVVTFHLTIAREKVALQPSASFVNHGHLEPDAWHALLRNSSCVVGLGHPVNAPTALEAIAFGAAYIAGSFDPPHALSDLPKHPIANQHQFVVSHGAPLAYAAKIDNARDLANAILACVSRPFAPRVLNGFTADEHAQRLQDEILSFNACRA